jgi:hypothetical protein
VEARGLVHTAVAGADSIQHMRCSSWTAFARAAGCIRDRFRAKFMPKMMCSRRTPAPDRIRCERARSVIEQPTHDKSNCTLKKPRAGCWP